MEATKNAWFKKSCHVKGTTKHFLPGKIVKMKTKWKSEFKMAKNVVWQSYQINDEDGANITNFKKRRRNTVQKRL